MVSTELPTVVTELPKLPLHFHQVANVKHWQPGGDVLATSCNTVTTVGDSLATHWQLIPNLETMATLGNFFERFENVAKRWRPLTIMAT